MSKGNVFYVYVLFRPWDGSPFYVGKGHGRRWLDHERRRDKHPNWRLSRILQKAHLLGMDIPKVKIRQALSEAAAFEIERAIIAALGRGKGELLSNMTDGGEGASNPAPETLAKRAEKTRGKKVPLEVCAKISATLMGHIHSAETKLKIGAKSKAMWSDPDIRRTLSAVNIGKVRSNEFRENVRAVHKGTKRSIETRAKMSVAAIGNKRALGHKRCEQTIAKLRAKVQSPETRLKISKAHVGKILSLEHRAKLSAAHRGKRLSPEHVAKIGAAHRGMKRGPEALKNMSQAQQRRYHPE